jgi:hypothetical protein
MFNAFKLKKIELGKGEEIIKEGAVHYRGGGIRRPLIWASAYGKLYLTNKRIVLEYFHLAIPTFNNIYGVLKRKIEISLAKVKNVKKYLLDIVEIEYEEDKTLRAIYFAPWKAFSSVGLIKIADDWVQKIQELVKKE